MLKSKSTKLTFSLCLLTALSLSACKNLPSQPTDAEPSEGAVTTTPVDVTPETRWKQHQAELKHITRFTVNGSMAYISGKTKNYARFLLNQKNRTTYDLKLTTPLGGSVMDLIVRPNFVELTDRQGKKYTGNNVEKLLNELTGMNIPLTSLHSWMIGLSHNAAADKINEDGLLTQTEFKQDNVLWAIKINAYNTKNTIALPSKVELTHKDEIIRLNINNWTL